MRRLDSLSIYKSSIVRFWYERAVVGVGFFVDPLRIITCAHVIASALNIKDVNESSIKNLVVTLDIPLSQPRKKFKAKIIFCNANNYLAGIEIIQEDYLVDRRTPLVILNEHELWGHRFRAFGFPNKFDDGIWATGKILGENEKGWVQIEDEDEIGHFIEKGFSGGPVWDENVNAVVGMIVAFKKPLNQRTAFFIPLRKMAKGWRELWDYSFISIANQWHKQVPANFEEREIDIASPLKRSFDRYRGKPFWHIRLLDLIDRIYFPIMQNVEYANFATVLKEINFDANYEMLWKSLKKVLEFYDKQVSKSLSRKIYQLEKEHQTTCRKLIGRKSLSDDEKGLLALDSIRANVRKLRKEFLHNTEFDKCFLCLGEMGAGKSYFVNDLLAKPPLGHLTVLLQPNYSEENLSTALLREIQRVSGINWPTLKAVNWFLKTNEKCNSNDKEYQNRINDFSEDENVENYLLQHSFDNMNTVFKYERNEKNARRIIFILDDLSRFALLHENFIGDLVNILRETTELHNFYWVLTAPQAYYFEMALFSSPRNSFWHRYGFSDLPSPSIDKWIVLDDLDREEKVGLNLIREFLEYLAREQEEDNYDFFEDEINILDLLCNPLIAWIWLDSIESSLTEPADPRINWMYIQFIDAFWKKQARLLLELEKNKKNENPLTEIELRKYVNWIARSLNETGDFYPTKSVLSNRLYEISQSRSEEITQARIVFALDILKQGLILREQTSTSLFDDLDSNFEILIDGFWGFLLSKELLRAYTSVPSSVEELDIRFSNINSRLLPVTLQFYLWLIDSKSKLPDIALRFCDLVLQSSVLPHSAVWRIGSHSSKELQAMLVKRALQYTSDKRMAEMEGETVFALASFLENLPLTIMSIPNKLSVFQRMYPKFKEYSLGSYFYYLVEKLFSKIDNIQILIDALPFFSNCEILDMTEELAQLSVYTFFKLQRNGNEADSNQTLSYLLAYLKKTGSEYSDAKKIPNQESGWKRYLFREWLLFYFFTEFASQIGVKVYDLLKRRGWYKFQKNRCLQKHMEQEANLAIGRLYRWGNTGRGGMNFTEFIDQLVTSKDRVDRQNACFIIYHTVPSQLGIMADEIDENFYESLKILNADDEISWIRNTAIGKNLFSKIS